MKQSYILFIALSALLFSCKGKIDSLFYTDDVKVINGKILVYDEKIRHFPPAIAKK